MTSFGETGTTVGVGAALEDRDYIFPQYREQGTFLWRGYTLEEVINQCMGNFKDAAKGRQMPVHYGSPKLNMVTISSPLSKFDEIQLRKYLRLRERDMLFGLLAKTE